MVGAGSVDGHCYCMTVCSGSESLGQQMVRETYVRYAALWGPLVADTGVLGEHGYLGGRVKRNKRGFGALPQACF